MVQSIYQIATWVFGLSVALVAYTMLIYPALAVLLAAIIRRSIRRGENADSPTVCFIIAAYNEEAVIAGKIEQTLKLDYPRDRLEIVVASDGSTDRTDAIVREYADRGVRLFRCEDRLGKTHTLNGAVASATADVIVFSDATGQFSPNAIRTLASYFADPCVGCVTGRVAYSYGSDVTSRGFRAYQRFAVAVRQAESAWGNETSVSGSIHAMRRALYRAADPAFSLDVINAVHTVAAGQRVLYEREAVSLEESRTRLQDEFNVRVRIAVRGTTMAPYILRTLSRPFRPLYLFQMISHKFFRWWLWAFLLAALVSHAVLAIQGGWYGWTFAVHAAAYAVAGIALLAGLRNIRLPWLSGPSLFLLGNIGMAIGAIRALRGHRMPRWEPIR